MKYLHLFMQFIHPANLFFKRFYTLYTVINSTFFIDTLILKDKYKVPRIFNMIIAATVLLFCA